MSVILFNQAIGPVRVDVFLSEEHSSVLEVTSHPVETGAKISDHAFLQPKKVTLKAADSFAAQTFQNLVNLQHSLEVFTLVTGLTVYENMLLTEMKATRDKITSQVLGFTATCKQVVVSTTESAQDLDRDGNDTTPSGAPGGTNSRNAALPSSTDPTTSDRVSGAVQRGDSFVATVPPGKAASIIQEAL